MALQVTATAAGFTVYMYPCKHTVSLCKVILHGQFVLLLFPPILHVFHAFQTVCKQPLILLRKEGLLRPEFGGNELGLEPLFTFKAYITTRPLKTTVFTDRVCFQLLKGLH